MTLRVFETLIFDINLSSEARKDNIIISEHV